MLSCSIGGEEEEEEEEDEEEVERLPPFPKTEPNSDECFLRLTDDSQKKMLTRISIQTCKKNKF